MVMRLYKKREHATPVMPAMGGGRLALRSLVRPLLAGPGQRLDGEVQRQMSNRLGHEFSRVRVHRGSVASYSSRALGTRAYTVGNHVVIDERAVGPGTAAGRDLLAHELTHVVQQGGHRYDAPAATGFSGVANRGGNELEARRAQAGEAVSPLRQMTGPVLQREDPDERKKQPKQETEAAQTEKSEESPGLEWPSLPGPSLLDQGLQIDPLLMLRVNQMLARERIQAGLYDLDLETLDRLFPVSPLEPMPQPKQREEKPAVPAGKGPEKPRAGKPGDLLKAVTKVPAVEAAISGLKEQALSRAKRDWKKLSTGGKVTLVSSLVLVGGSALGGIMAHDRSRNAALGFIKDKQLPVPGVPGLSMQLNLVGPDLGVQFGLNVGRLLPRSWGFK